MTQEHASGAATTPFGTRLRLQREQRGVALTAIAAETKIKVSLLEALERNDVSQWPTGIFRRAYIRSYAQAIGLDPGEVVREFLELYPDPAEVLAAAEEEAEIAAQSSTNRLRRLVTSAIAAVPAFQHPHRREAGARPPLTPPREYVVRSARADAGPLAPDAGDRDERGDAQPAFGDPIPHPVHDRTIDPVPAELSDDEFVLVPPPVFAEACDGAEDSEPGLADAARLCTKLARVVNRCDLMPVLDEAAAVLGAVGLVVWAWDARSAVLRPSLAQGYSDAMLARLPVVQGDDDNAIAGAFRSGDPCIVNGGRDVTGAAVIPLTGPAGCVGVLALELRRGGEQRESVRAVATILAAQLVSLIGPEPRAEAATA